MSDLRRATESRLVTLLRVGSVRFSAMYFLPFYAAVAMSGHGHWGWIAAGGFCCVLVCLGIELANRCADRTEDAINRPERTAMCERLGYRNLAIVAIAIFVLLIPVGITWFLLYFNVGLFAVQATVWLVAWNYSYGLRFKARRRLSLLVLGGTFVLPFLVAWTMYQSPRQLPVILGFVPLFVLSVAGAKDITDVAGDRARRYRSLMVDLLGRGLPLLASWLAVPYLFVVAAVAIGSAAPRFLALLVFLPASAALVLLLREARGEETAAAREWTYHLWMAVLATTLGLLHPSPPFLAVQAGALAFWVVATRRLHWYTGLRAEQVATAVRVLSRARA